LKTDQRKLPTLVFRTLYDNQAKKVAFVKLVILFLILAVPFLIEQDFFLLVVLAFILAGWFTTDFYNQPQKINLLEDRLILKMLTGSVNLFYENIKEVHQPTPQYFKLLKRKTTGFQFWGKKGWYSSKFLENIFIYLLSGNIEDQILIKYGIDYYLISVADSDELIRQLEIRCGLNK